MSPPIPRLSPKGESAITSLLQETVRSRKTAAVFFGVSTVEGEIYFGHDGKVRWDDEQGEDVGEETTLQLYSSTKLVTTIACLKLFQENLQAFDDPDLIKTHLPELGRLEILRGFDDDDKPVFEPQDPGRPITLRLLLTHSSGLTYTFNNPNLARWAETSDTPNMLGNQVTERAWMYPLNAQPGVEWHYGVGIDWAGILIARITGMDLQAYFEREIFLPLGLMDAGGLSFYPTEEVKRKMMRLTFGDEQGIRGCFPDNFSHQPFKREEDPDKVGPLLSGGAGLFGTARAYLALLRAILQSDPDHAHAHAHPRPLLTPPAYRMLFQDCLDPRTDKRPMVQMMISGTFHGANLTADPEGGKVGHSLGLLLNFEDSDHGRRAGSGSWDGAAKTQFWIDPKTGIAGICFTNCFTTNPNPFYKMFNKLERILYDHLE